MAEAVCCMRSLGCALAIAALGFTIAGCAGDGQRMAEANLDSAMPDAGVALDAAQPTDAARPMDGGDLPWDAGMDRAALIARLRLAGDPYRTVAPPAENPLSDAKVMLGKALFWDVQLSTTDSVACGTCHQPAAGGSDGRPAEVDAVGHPGADGRLGTADDPRGSAGVPACDVLADGGIVFREHEIYGRTAQVTRRRSMGFLDLTAPSKLFWDGRASETFLNPLTDGGVVIPVGAALETQSLMPILNEVEMACKGATWEDLCDKLAGSRPLAKAEHVGSLGEFLDGVQRYDQLFLNAFGSAEVTPVRIGMALASYERTLTSHQTPWDAFQAGDDGALTDAQLQGLQLFLEKAGCNVCHQMPGFQSKLFVDDGFIEDPWDLGRQEVTGLESQRSAFRVVSLRNVGLRESAGLLHDGLFPGTGLLSLVQAYNQPPVYGAGPFRRALHLTDDEMAALVAFLKEGLTDSRVKREQPPFDHPALASPQ